MRPSSRQLQFLHAVQQPLDSEHQSSLEPPSVEPLTPTEDGPIAAARVASLLDRAVLITNLIKLSEDTGTLRETLLSLPESEWGNLQISLKKILHHCQELYALGQENNGQISGLANNHANPQDCHDDCPTLDLPYRLEDDQRVEEVQLQEDAFNADDEIGDIHLSFEFEENSSEVEGKVEDGQSSEGTLLEKDTSEDEIEGSQPPDSTVISQVNGDYPERLRTVRADSPDSTASPLNPQESPSKYTATTLVGSPQSTPIQTRETTPEISTAGVTEDPYWSLVTQSDIEFAAESLEQVKNFSIPGNSHATIKHVWDSLQDERSATSYSDGSEWVKLLTDADASRERSSVYSAVATLAFFRWHRGQVELEARKLEERNVARYHSKKPRTTKNATINVNQRIGHEKDRAKVRVKLLRGRRWSQVVDGLGLGILFRHAWALGKASETSLDHLVSALQKSKEKVFVLGELATQLEMFLSTGRTNTETMEQALRKRGLLGFSSQSISQEVNDLQMSIKEAVAEPMIESSITDKLHINVRGLDWGCYFIHLDRLKEETWFSGDLIQLCMQLADKLQHMRVGFTVSFHDEKTGSALPRPLQWAAQQVKTWTTESAANLPLVCFFPLHLHNNHFVLLEINGVDGRVYCYDTGSGGLDDAQEACRNEFPNLPFQEQRISGRNDATSCGPCVVAIARKRMMCRSAENIGPHDPFQLRLDALHLIRTAWDSGMLIPVPGDDNNAEDDACMLIEKPKGLEAEETHPPRQGKREHGTDSDYTAPNTRRKARRLC
ncbi:hypothetical protein PG985_006697 [Apiospora marii]|uniref:Ubiquitin-like protease family profile domain-containing protein n=1 Tax=Apiospora marii TaxID=335849 RepID=A0ABR1S8D2_9PEZI